MPVNKTVCVNTIAEPPRVTMAVLFQSKTGGSALGAAGNQSEKGYGEGYDRNNYAGM